MKTTRVKYNCDICGQSFIPKNPGKWYTYTGYQSLNYCSDDCWNVLTAQAAIDNYDGGTDYKIRSSMVAKSS